MGPYPEHSLRGRSFPFCRDTVLFYRLPIICIYIRKNKIFSWCIDLCMNNFHHTTCESTCDTLTSSAANQGDNTVSVTQGGTATPGANEQLLPPDRVFNPIRCIDLYMNNNKAMFNVSFFFSFFEKENIFSVALLFVAFCFKMYVTFSAFKTFDFILSFLFIHFFFISIKSNVLEHIYIYILEP